MDPPGLPSPLLSPIFSPSAVLSSFSDLRPAAIHLFMCTSRIRDGPPERLLRRRLTAHSISPSSGTESLTIKGFIVTGMLSPGDGICLYSANLSAAIRSSVTRAGGGAWSTADLYHPWIRCQASWMRGGSAPTSASTVAPALSARRLQSAAKLALIARPSRLFNACPFAGYWHAETLLLTSFHVSANIHAFRIASCAFAFGTALNRAENASSSSVGFVGGLSSRFFCPPRYFFCSGREALGGQPRTF